MGDGVIFCSGLGGIGDFSNMLSSFDNLGDFSNLVNGIGVDGLTDMFSILGGLDGLGFFVGDLAVGGCGFDGRFDVEVSGFLVADA